MGNEHQPQGLCRPADPGHHRREAVHALDRTLTALSVDPALGIPIPGSHPELRVDDVRVIYYVTALSIVIACIEY
ncbi:hypothetical protein ACXZ65_28120 [Streptomyces aculeolatus]